LALMEALHKMATNTVMTPSLINLTGLKDQSLKPETLRRAREELTLMEDNYRYLCATNLTALGIDLVAQRLEWKHRELEFERQQNQARFKMPFAGQLNPSLQVAEGVTEYPVNAGQELAVARDLSVILLRTPLAEASWSTLPADELTALLNLPDGTTDSEYLAWLDQSLSSGLRQFSPDLLCYIAGADPYREDQLGGLALTIEGLKQRDELVFKVARQRGIPVMVTYAGGYARDVEDTVTIHVNTIVAAKSIWSREA